MLSRRCSSHFQMFPLRNCLAFQTWKQPHLKRAFEPFDALNGWRTPCREVPDVQFHGIKRWFQFNDSRKITFCFPVSRETYHSVNHSSRIIYILFYFFYNNGSRRIKTRDHVSQETPLRPLSDYILNFNEMATEKPRIRKTRNSLCKQLIIRRRRCAIRPCFLVLCERFNNFRTAADPLF